MAASARRHFTHDSVPFAALPRRHRCLLIVLGAIFAWRPRRPRIIAKPLMTANEIEFFHRLRAALPGFHVFPQVAFGALMTHAGMLPAREMWRVCGFQRRRPPIPT